MRGFGRRAQKVASGAGKLINESSEKGEISIILVVLSKGRTKFTLLQQFMQITKYM
jgi:hypothetical protein